MYHIIASLLLAVFLCETAKGQVNQCLVKRFGTEAGDTYFDDWNDYSTDGNLTGVRIYHREFIHGIQFQYGGVWTTLHGSGTTAAAMSDFYLTGSQFIDKIDIRHGRYVDMLHFYLTDGTNTVDYGPFGGWGGDHDVADPTCGYMYFKGQTGDYLDLLNVYTDCTWCEP